MATGNVFGLRMGSGIPGRITRQQNYKGEPQTLSTTNPPLAFGDPVKIGSDGFVQALAAGDTVTSVYGFIENVYPTQQTGNYLSQGFGTTVPAPGSRCTIMRSGYMSVAVQGTTPPANGGQVFIRIGGTPPTGGRLNGLETTADATAANSIALPLPVTSFKGAADVGSVTEICFNA
jgi:hypothetical protein